MIPDNFIIDFIFFIIIIAFSIHYIILHYKKPIRTIDTSDYYIGVYHQSNKKYFKFIELKINDGNDEYSLIFNYKNDSFRCSNHNASVYCKEHSNRNMKFIYDLLGAKADNKMVTVAVSDKSNSIIYILKDDVN